MNDWRTIQRIEAANTSPAFSENRKEQQHKTHHQKPHAQKEAVREKKTRHLQQHSTFGQHEKEGGEREEHYRIHGAPLLHLHAPAGRAPAGSAGVGDAVDERRGTEK